MTQRDRILEKLSVYEANAVKAELHPIQLDSIGELVFLKKCNRNEQGMAASAAGEIVGGRGSGFGYVTLVNMLRFALVDEAGVVILNDIMQCPRFVLALDDPDTETLLSKLADLNAPDTGAELEEPDTPLAFSGETPDS